MSLFTEYEHEQDYGAFKKIQAIAHDSTSQNNCDSWNRGIILVFDSLIAFQRSFSRYLMSNYRLRISFFKKSIRSPRLM